MGRIPILITTHMDSLYDQLPVLVVPKWADVTQDFLAKRWSELSNAKYNYDKLWQPYWLLHILRTALRTQ